MSRSAAKAAAATYKARKLELDYGFRFRMMDLLASAIGLLIPWSCLALISLFAHWSVVALAGQATTAEIGIRFLGKIRIDIAIVYALGLACVVYGRYERSLRQRTVERLQRRNQELEQRLDPQRSTSGLTPRGTTRPEDRR